MTRLCTAAIAGLLMCSASLAIAQPQAQTVLVFSFGFSPQPIHLVAGHKVTLIFVNQSDSSHDFTAGRFFSSSTIIAGAPTGGEIDLKPHETKAVTLVPQAGTYSAHCSHFMHKLMGMRDEIIVD